MMIVRNDGQVLPFCDRSFDAVVLFTVLTCIPFDEDQIALLAEIRRTLRPGGLLYISDLLLNSDERNIERYKPTRANLIALAFFSFLKEQLSGTMNRFGSSSLRSHFPSSPSRDSLSQR
jgi:SAM-dependent methyltransferase